VDSQAEMEHSLGDVIVNVSISFPTFPTFPSCSPVLPDLPIFPVL
jgi:hypothetical protein